MTASPDVPLSKGMMMIVAYREARLRQRPVLRTSLDKSGGVARCLEQAAGEPGRMTTVEIPAPVATAVLDAPETPLGLGLAKLANATVFDERIENIRTPADVSPPIRRDMPPDVVAVAPPNDALPAPTHSAEPVPHDPPLAELGFGPGMLTRLGQIGLRTTGDLAHADPDALRAALGGISRLVDVEAWIASARTKASTAAEEILK